jgi:hypothetical protein
MDWIIFVLAFVFISLLIAFALFLLLIYSDELSYNIGSGFVDAFIKLNEAADEVKWQIGYELMPILIKTPDELNKLLGNKNDSN